MPSITFPSRGTRGGSCQLCNAQTLRVQETSLAPAPCSLTPTPTGTTLDVVEVESYDPYTDTWAPVSPALKYVSNFSAAGCQGRLYLVGSSACKYNALALQCYNPVTGEGTATCNVGSGGEWVGRDCGGGPQETGESGHRPLCKATVSS